MECVLCRLTGWKRGVCVCVCVVEAATDNCIPGGPADPINWTDVGEGVCGVGWEWRGRRQTGTSVMG